MDRPLKDDPVALLALLKAYISRVIDCESVSFIESGGPVHEFTSEQLALLLQLEAEVMAADGRYVSR